MVIGYTLHTTSKGPRVEKKKKSMIKRSLGGLLKARRLEQKLTLQELADKADLSAAFLSQAERGKATPSIVSLINIAPNWSARPATRDT